MDAGWADLTDERGFFFFIRVYLPNPRAKHPRSIFCVHIRKLNEYIMMSFPRRRESTALKEDRFLPTQE